MKTGSLCALLVTLGGAAWLGACSSSNSNPGAPPAEAGAGGSSAGGAGSGGKASGGAGGTASGGAGGAAGGTAGGGGSAGASGAANSGGSDGGNADAGDGGPSCVFPRCRPKYPTVLFSAANPYSDDKAMLGKILFWEEQLGQLDTMACGTCHRSAQGGSDPRTNDAAAKLPGPDGIAQAQPDINSDDLRVAQGVPVCTIAGAITGALQTTTRKPPTYLDAMFAQQIFWDGRAGYCKNAEAAGGCFYDPDMLATNANAAPLIKGVLDTASGFTAGGALEQQASGPPANQMEMACAGRTWAAIEAKLQNASLIPLAKTRSRIPVAMNTFIAAHGNNYPQMFRDVFGSDARYKVTPATDPDNIINARRIVFAIATHERRLTSDQTPWDLWNDGTAAHANAMTPAQINGFTLFMGKAKCGSCHAPPLFTDLGFHNIGFHKPVWDIGRKNVTNTDADATKFKTPTLRNVGLREPFGILHDGDGPGHSLDTVMQLYNMGGKRTDPEIAGVAAGGIDPIMSGPLGLTGSEIADILDFIRNGLTDPRVRAEAPPFDRPILGTEP